MAAEMDYRDILLADLVVVGDIRGYEIVDPDPDPNRGDLLNYARFTVRIREVLLAKTDDALPLPKDEGGRAIQPRSRITVTWDNSTFGEPAALPDDEHEGYLIALRRPSSPLPPQRLGSAFVAQTPEPEHFTILQAPCAGPFLFRMDSLVAIALRQLLTTDRDREAEWAVLSDFLFKNGAVGIVDRKLRD
jgi:hypothetical protein